MQLWRYTAAPAIAYGGSIVLLAIIWAILKAMCPSVYAEDLKHCLAQALRRDLLEKCESKDSTVWRFKSVKVLNKNDEKRIINFVALTALMAFFCVSVVFWRTLLIDISYDCERHDPFEECFLYDPTKKFDLKGFFVHASANPVNCSSEEIVNGTVSVICYQHGCRFAFRRGSGMGVFQGSLDVSSTLLLVAWSGVQYVSKALSFLRLLPPSLLQCCSIATSLVTW